MFTTEQVVRLMQLYLQYSNRAHLDGFKRLNAFDFLTQYNKLGSIEKVIEHNS